MAENNKLGKFTYTNKINKEYSIDYKFNGAIGLDLNKIIPPEIAEHICSVGYINEPSGLVDLYRINKHTGIEIITKTDQTTLSIFGLDSNIREETLKKLEKPLHSV